MTRDQYDEMPAAPVAWDDDDFAPCICGDKSAECRAHAKNPQVHETAHVSGAPQWVDDAADNRMSIGPLAVESLQHTIDEGGDIFLGFGFESQAREVRKHTSYPLSLDAEVWFAAGQESLTDLRVSEANEISEAQLRWSDKLSGVYTVACDPVDPPLIAHVPALPEDEIARPKPRDSATVVAELARPVVLSEKKCRGCGRGSELNRRRRYDDGRGECVEEYGDGICGKPLEGL